MKIVTTTHNLHRRFSIYKIIELIARAGFDGIDFSDIPIMTEVWNSSYVNYAKSLCHTAEDFGVKFYQAHAPVISDLLNAGDMDFAIERTYRSIEFSSLMGIDTVVVHPLQHSQYATKSDFVYEENMKFFNKLIPCCRDCGVKVAIENMVMPTLDGLRKRDGVCASPDEFKKYIDDLNSEYITGCLDFGHSALSGREPQDMLRVMGADRIKSVHIHDNDYISDCHQLPCTMKLNWDEICKALAEIKYEGHFTLEATCFTDNYDDEFIPQALSFMYKTSCHLVNKVQNYANLTA